MGNDRTDFQKKMDTAIDRALSAVGGTANAGMAIGRVTDGNTTVLVVTAAEDLVDVRAAFKNRMRAVVSRRKLPSVAKLADEALKSAQGGAVSASGADEVTAEKMAALKESEDK